MSAATPPVHGPESGVEIADELATFADAVATHDDATPFNEATLLSPNDRIAHFGRDAAGNLIALALSFADGDVVEAEFAVHPRWRRRGLGSALVSALTTERVPLHVWAHGDLPGSRELARTVGAQPQRELYVLELPLNDTTAPLSCDMAGADAHGAGNLADASRTDRTADAAPSSDDGADNPAPHIRPFNPARDADAWVELNAAVFADHPEQGGLRRADLDARMAQPWFNAGDFLVLDDGTGALIGYCWCKVDGDTFEIYVVGVDPRHAGRGYGRALMNAGLTRLRARGGTHAILYVDGDNTAAMTLYRRLGFTDRSVDVQYQLVRAQSSAAAVK